MLSIGSSAPISAKPSAGSGTRSKSFVQDAEACRRRDQDCVYELLLIVTPQTSLTGLTLFIDGLRAVNRVSGAVLFKWQIATLNGEPVAASNGLPIVADCAIYDAPTLPHVAVFASYELSEVKVQPLASFIRRAARHGSKLLGIDQGAVFLAQLGLLNGFRATAHWEVIPSLTERFPKVSFVDELFVRDRNRLTCAGHTACLDFALDIAEQAHGKALALAAASELIYDRIRPGTQSQRMFETSSKSVMSGPLARATGLMAEHIGDPLPIRRIAVSAGISMRQLECHFQTYLKVSPQRYCLLLRLSHARKLLLYSSMKIGAISAACGFASQGSFTRAFSTEFHVTPTSYRRRFLDSQDRPYVVQI